MSHSIEFVRGEQKNYIRLTIDDETLSSYEFQMFSHNHIKVFLPFQKRIQNDKTYLYYDVSGTQSLDVLGQTQKLQRDFWILFAKEVLKLYKNIKEYMLSVGGVVFEAKYIMYKDDTKELLFVYSFEKGAVSLEALNAFLEYCIDYLDYSDKRLSDCIFRLYEHLQDQGDNFSMETEMENLLASLGEGEKMPETSTPEPVVQSVQPFESVFSSTEERTENYEDISGVASRKSRRGILLLLLVDVLGAIIWKPISILKLCFFLSLGVCLLVLYVHMGKKERANQEKSAEESRLQEVVYRNEYEMIASQCDEEEGTKFIAIEHMSGVLYSLQGLEPQYIYITEKLQLIGKDQEKAPICISAEGVSRVHASIIRKGDDCYLEDLCSTNGTYVNGKNIGARSPYLLKEGDRVSFAGVEYIFQ